MAFDAFQRLKTIDEELERADENFALLQDAQQKEDMQDIQHTGLVVVVLVCFVGLLLLFMLGCGSSVDSPTVGRIHDLSGQWSRTTDTECVGDIDQDFLLPQLDTKYTSLDEMLIEQNGDDLVVILGEGEYERETGVIEGDEIRLLTEEWWSWIAGCAVGSYWCELSFSRFFTIRDHGQVIAVDEIYESHDRTTICTHEWMRWLL